MFQLDEYPLGQTGSAIFTFYVMVYFGATNRGKDFLFQFSIYSAFTVGAWHHLLSRSGRHNAEDVGKASQKNGPTYLPICRKLAGFWQVGVGQ